MGYKSAAGVTIFEFPTSMTFKLVTFNAAQKASHVGGEQSHVKVLNHVSRTTHTRIDIISIQAKLFWS
jgi:hypothetical protein